MKNEKKDLPVTEVTDLRTKFPVSNSLIVGTQYMSSSGEKLDFQTHSTVFRPRSEKRIGHSLTVPGRSLSPQQVMDRFASGRPVTAMPSHYPYPEDWDGSNPLPDFDQMDLSDMEDFRNANQLRIDELKAKLDSDRAEAKKRYLEARAKSEAQRKAIEAIIASKQSTGGVQGAGS